MIPQKNILRSQKHKKVRRAHPFGCLGGYYNGECPRTVPVCKYYYKWHIKALAAGGERRQQGEGEYCKWIVYRLTLLEGNENHAVLGLVAIFLDGSLVFHYFHALDGLGID